MYFHSIVYTTYVEVMSNLHTHGKYFTLESLEFSFFDIYYTFYTFIFKSISNQSSTYICTYSFGGITELSRPGFSKTLVLA